MALASPLLSTTESGPFHGEFVIPDLFPTSDRVLEEERARGSDHALGYTLKYGGQSSVLEYLTSAHFPLPVTTRPNSNRCSYNTKPFSRCESSSNIEIHLLTIQIDESQQRLPTSDSFNLRSVNLSLDDPHFATHYQRVNYVWHNKFSSFLQIIPSLCSTLHWIDEIFINENLN